ncbi:hypothetical protein KY343_03735 [Candidatus Woesearchaeota archaeon]|nr:hypothetical protein [Candidatus Woesearchaeota archaeon]
MRDKPVTLRLTIEEYEVLFEFMKERNCHTMSDAVRILLDNINNNKKQLTNDMNYHKELYEKKKKRIEELDKKEEEKKKIKESGNDLQKRAMEHLEKLRKSEM